MFESTAFAFGASNHMAAILLFNMLCGEYLKNTKQLKVFVPQSKQSNFIYHPAVCLNGFPHEQTL